MKISTIIIHGFINEHPVRDLITDKTKWMSFLISNLMKSAKRPNRSAVTDSEGNAFPENFPKHAQLKDA